MTNPPPRKLSKEDLDLLDRLYPVTSNVKLSMLLRVSKSEIHRTACRRGLSKSASAMPPPEPRSPYPVPKWVKRVWGNKIFDSGGEI